MSAKFLKPYSCSIFYIPPFQGYCRIASPPRALPWAMVFHPVGVEKCKQEHYEYLARYAATKFAVFR